MRVVFVYLPHPYLKQPDSQLPLGLLYLAAVVESRNLAEVELRNYSSSSTADAIEDLPEAELYGITATSLDLPAANHFASKIKAKYPLAKIILGGPGSTTPEYMDRRAIDSVCWGEGEPVMPAVIADVRRGTIAEQYEGPEIADLDSLPFPARHLLSHQGGNVFAYDKNYREGGSTVITTSRGCASRCAFCSSPRFSQRIRFRSVPNVIAEMKHVIREFGIRQFRFSDDTFTAKKTRVMELCKEIARLDVVWRASVRVKPFDADTCKAMVDSGCKEVSPGIESFDNDVLKVLNKLTTAEANAKFLELAAKHGLNTRVLMMVGTPGQTRKTVPTNIEWLKRVPYTMIAAKSFVPIPGSEIWENPRKFGVTILNREMKNYNYFFFGPGGEFEKVDLVQLDGRSVEEVRAETREFLGYLKTTGKMNAG